MAGRGNEKSEDDDFASVSAMADRLKLKGKDRTKYIHDHMTGFGYRMVPSYVRADDDDDDDGGGRFFGGGRSRSSSRSSRSRDDDDDGFPF